MSNPVIQSISHKVDELYNWRDVTPISESLTKKDKENKLQNETQNIIIEINKLLETSEITTTTKDKAFVQYLMGKTYNILPTYSSNSELSLSKSIKLDPTLIDSWLQLGESYWKKGDVIAAKNCFSGALEQDPKNVVALRNMSMVLRMLPTENIEQKKSNVDESVKLAREAVSLSAKDGVSWYVLGNAYLASFFIPQTPIYTSTYSETFEISKTGKDVKNALAAYHQAENSPIARNNPDLYFNRAVLHKYQEEYQEAVHGFRKAIVLEGGEWHAADIHIKQINDFIYVMETALTKKGNLPPKKLHQIIESVATIHPSPLVSLNRTASPISSLVTGVNSGVFITACVIDLISPEGWTPLSFALVDGGGKVIGLSVYNLIPGVVQIGTSITIPEPFVKIIEFNLNGKLFVYTSIQADASQIEVGGKTGDEVTAQTTLEITNSEEIEEQEKNKNNVQSKSNQNSSSNSSGSRNRGKQKKGK